MISSVVELRKLTDTLIEQESKKSQMVVQAKEWQYAFNAVPDAIFIVNNNYDIKFANKSFLDLYNTTFEDIYDKKCYEFLSDTEKALDCYCEGFAESFRDLGELVIKNTNKWFHYTRSAIHTDTGEIIGYICVLRDITCKKLQSKQFKMLNSFL